MSSIFDAENGDSLVTTLDKTVQYYLEKGLEELGEPLHGTGVGATGTSWTSTPAASRDGVALPWTSTPPREHLQQGDARRRMTDEELAAAADTLQNMQWRNKAINDTFQPGSTFQILTLAMALEENKGQNVSDTFNCPGYVVIEGAKIKLLKRAPGHGHQDLITAFANSCNPAFINIGLRLGNTTFTIT